MPTKICDCCGITFILKQNHPRYRFCSSSCKHKWRHSQEDYKIKERLEKKLARERNPEKFKEKDRQQYQKYKSRYFANNAKRRYYCRSQKDLWDAELTSFVFIEACDLRQLRNEATGIEWHIDHIVPLFGKNVCGLHVWNNFAVIPKVENLRKGNYHPIYV